MGGSGRRRGQPRLGPGLNAKAAPHAVKGTYLNLDLDADEARVRWTFGEEKYARLAALKQAWDPESVFTFNAPIPPAKDLTPA